MPPGDGDPLTVVVATRNRQARLSGCLHELTELPERPAVVVVDNGSTDDTASMVRNRFPSVSLIQLPHNEGAVARNVGVRHASTPVVAFADDDSGWQPGSLAAAAEHLRQHPRLGLIAAQILVGPDKRVDDVARFMATAPIGREADLPGPSVLGFLACAAVVRRDAFLQTGGFDPVVFFMGEEARVAYDLAHLGWGLAYCDDVVAWHDPGRPPDPARLSLAGRNRALTSWMRRPLPVALADTVALIARARSSHGRRAMRELIRRLPDALAHRVPPDPGIEVHLRALRRSQQV